MNFSQLEILRIIHPLLHSVSIQSNKKVAQFSKGEICSSSVVLKILNSFLQLDNSLKEKKI